MTACFCLNAFTSESSKRKNLAKKTAKLNDEDMQLC